MKARTKPKPLNADTPWASIAQKMLKHREVTHAKMFGVPGIKTGGKMFAMSVKGELIVKLPKGRVDSLLASNKGKQFYHLFDKDRVMKEWVAIGQKNKRDWTKLAREAKDFVTSTKNDKIKIH